MSKQGWRLTTKGLRLARYRREFSSLENLCHSVLSEPIKSNWPKARAADIRWIEGCLAVIKEIHQEAIDEGH